MFGIFFCCRSTLVGTLEIEIWGQLPHYGYLYYFLKYIQITYLHYFRFQESDDAQGVVPSQHHNFYFSINNFAMNISGVVRGQHPTKGNHKGCLLLLKQFLLHTLYNIICTAMCEVTCVKSYGDTLSGGGGTAIFITQKF